MKRIIQKQQQGALPLYLICMLIFEFDWVTVRSAIIYFEADFLCVTGLMSEPPKRHSTRERRPPKFRQMPELEFGAGNDGRPTEAKDPISNTQETNQLAKLLVKFINSSNTKLRDNQREDNSQLPLGSAQNRPVEHPYNGPTKIICTRDPQGPSDGQNPLTRQRDGERGFSQTTKAGTRPYTKRGEPTKKGTMGLPSSIQSDLSYHTMLGQHIRSNLPDSHNLSHEMLMQLGLPSKELLEQSKGKEVQKKKKASGGPETKIGRQSRQQLKPFKRQSYHVAIAYHIFLKQIKAGPNPSPRDIDPTYNARKLRDQSQKQP